MPATKSKPKARSKPREQRIGAEEWTRIVGELCATIDGWSKAMKWKVRSEERNLEDERGNSYSLPVLHVDAADGKMEVEPQLPSAFSRFGYVELRGYPTFNKLMLVYKDGRWGLQTDSFFDWPEAWSKRTYSKIPRLLASAR